VLNNSCKSAGTLVLLVLVARTTLALDFNVPAEHRSAGTIALLVLVASTAFTIDSNSCNYFNYFNF